MRIALGQMAATTDKVANLRVVAGVIQGASDDGAELVVLPEAAMCSFARPRIEGAEPFDGPWANAVREMAKLAGVTVVVGMFTTTGGPRVRNTLLVTGAVEARYDKVHLFDALGYAESRQIEDGDRAVTFPLGGHTFGLATCYDVRFPGLFTHLAELGAEAILLPSSWVPGPQKLHQWRTLVIARAMDSTAFLVAVDQAQPDTAGDGKPTGIGHSLVVDSTGTVIVELGDGSEYAVLDLDLDAVAEVRERLPVLQHARDVSRWPSVAQHAATCHEPKPSGIASSTHDSPEMPQNRVRPSRFAPAEDLPGLATRPARGNAHAPVELTSVPRAAVPRPTPPGSEDSKGK